MRPEEQRIRFKDMPGEGGRTLHIPKLRGGRPGQKFEDKSKYRRDREKERFRREMFSLSDLVRQVAAKTGIMYDSFSTQIDLPSELDKKIKDWCQKIPEEDLYDNDEHEYGLENDHHVTVLYGIKNKEPGAVKELLEQFKPFKVRLGLVTAFRDDKRYDVLKVDAEAPELHKMHYALADNLDNDHSFPTYAPHMTLAYLKKGKADKYLGDDSFRNDTFKVSDVKFCLKDSSKLSVPLKD